MSALVSLLNGVLWGSALAATVWLALRFTPRHALAASARYAIWWLTLAASLALPLANLRPAPSSAPLVEIDGARARVPPIERIPLPPWHPHGVPRLAVKTGWWMDAAAATWLAVAIILLLRVALSFAAIERARRRAQPAPDPWPARLPHWLASVGAEARAIRLAASSEVAVPAAAGPVRPAILIPVRLFGDAGEGDIERIGLHEAAHFARRDDWALPAQRLIEAVLWAHPAVRLIGRELDVEREIACDDRVVNATGEAHAYAACLMRMIELCGTARGATAVPTMADNRSRISRRIELLLERSGQASGSRAALAVAAVALALGAAAFAEAPAVFDFRAPVPAPSIQLIERAGVPPVKNELIPEKIMSRIHRVKHFAAAMAAAATMAAAEPPQQPAPQTNLAPPLAVLYFDLSALDANQLAAAAKAAHQFLPARPRAELTAVISYDGATVRVAQDFTGDAAVVDAAIDKLTPVAAIPVSTARPSLAGLGETVHLLEPVKGKKALVYFAPKTLGYSGGDAQLQDVVNAAIRANVAFFPIEVRGAN